jgi:hypothetical protein
MSVTTPSRSVGNLLVDLTSFVGRRQEPGEVKRALRLAEEPQGPIARSYAAFARGMYQTYTADLPGAIATFEAGLTVAAPLSDVAWRLDRLMPLSVSYDLMGQRYEQAATLLGCAGTFWRAAGSSPAAAPAPRRVPPGVRATDPCGVG